MRFLQAGLGIVLAICVAFLGGAEGTRLHGSVDSRPAPAAAETPTAALAVPASTTTSANDTMYVQAPPASAEPTAPEAAPAAPTVSPAPVVQMAVVGGESEVSVEVLHSPAAAPVAAPVVQEPPTAPAAQEPPAAPDAQVEQGPGPAGQGPGEATVTLIDPYAPPPGGAVLPPEAAAGGDRRAAAGGAAAADRPVIQIVEPGVDPNSQIMPAPDGQQPPANQPGAGGQPADGPGLMIPGAQQGPFEPAPVVVVERPQPVTIVAPPGGGVYQPYVYYPPPAWVSTCYVSNGPGYAVYQGYPRSLWPPDPYYDDIYASDWATDFYLGVPVVGYGCYGPFYGRHHGLVTGFGYRSYCGSGGYFGLGFTSGYGGSYLAAFGGYGYGWGLGFGWGRPAFGRGHEYREIVHHGFDHPWDARGGHAIGRPGPIGHGPVIGPGVGRPVAVRNDHVTRSAPVGGVQASVRAAPPTPAAPSRMTSSAAPRTAQPTPSVAATRRPAGPAGATDASEPAGRMIDTRSAISHAGPAAGATAGPTAGASAAPAGARPSSLAAGSSSDAATLDSIAQKRQAYREMVRTSGVPAVAGGGPNAAAGSTAAGASAGNVPSRAYTSAKPGTAGPGVTGATGATDPRATAIRRAGEAPAKTAVGQYPAAGTAPKAGPPTATPSRASERDSATPAPGPTIRKTMSSGAINYVPGRDATPSAPGAAAGAASPARTVARPVAEPARAVSAQPAAPAVVTPRMDPRSALRDDSAADGSTVRTSPSGPTRTGTSSDSPSDYRPSRSYGRSGAGDSDRSGSGASRGRR